MQIEPIEPLLVVLSQNSRQARGYMKLLTDDELTVSCHEYFEKVKKSILNQNVSQASLIWFLPNSQNTILIIPSGYFQYISSRVCSSINDCRNS